MQRKVTDLKRSRCINLLDYFDDSLEQQSTHDVTMSDIEHGTLQARKRRDLAREYDTNAGRPHSSESGQLQACQANVRAQPKFVSVVKPQQ